MTTHSRVLPGEAHGQRETLWTMVHRVAKSQTGLKQLSMHIRTLQENAISVLFFCFLFFFFFFFSPHSSFLHGNALKTKNSKSWLTVFINVI